MGTQQILRPRTAHSKSENGSGRKENTNFKKARSKIHTEGGNYGESCSMCAGLRALETSPEVRAEEGNHVFGEGQQQRYRL